MGEFEKALAEEDSKRELDDGLFEHGARWAREWVKELFEAPHLHSIEEKSKTEWRESAIFWEVEQYGKLRTENAELKEDQQIKFDIIMQHGMTIQRLRGALEKISTAHVVQIDMMGFCDNMIGSEYLDIAKQALKETWGEGE